VSSEEEKERERERGTLRFHGAFFILNFHRRVVVLFPSVSRLRMFPACKTGFQSPREANFQFTQFPASLPAIFLRSSHAPVPLEYIERKTFPAGNNSTVFHDEIIAKKPNAIRLDMARIVLVRGRVRAINCNLYLRAVCT